MAVLALIFVCLVAARSEIVYRRANSSADDRAAHLTKLVERMLANNFKKLGAQQKKNSAVVRLTLQQIGAVQKSQQLHNSNLVAKNEEMMGIFHEASADFVANLNALVDDSRRMDPDDCLSLAGLMDPPAHMRRQRESIRAMIRTYNGMVHAMNMASVSVGAHGEGSR